MRVCASMLAGHMHRTMRPGSSSASHYQHAGQFPDTAQPLQIYPGRDRASAPIHAGPHRRQSTGRGIARPGQTACRMKGKARNAPSICCSLLSKNVHLLRMLQGRPYMLELSKKESI